MTDVAAPVNPIAETPQNDFREQAISPAAELHTWERSTSDRTPRLAIEPGVTPGADAAAFLTVAGTIGAALDGAGNHGLTDPLPLLPDDPARRQATITSFATAQCYLAANRSAFQGFADRVALAGLNAVPMPGMVFVENNLFVVNSSRAVWVMLIGTPAAVAWCSVMIDRSTRAQP